MFACSGILVENHGTRHFGKHFIEWKINIEKKIMPMGMYINIWHKDIYIKGRYLKKVNSFKHLEAIIIEDYRLDKEVKTRIEVANTALGKLRIF